MISGQVTPLGTRFMSATIRIFLVCSASLAGRARTASCQRRCPGTGLLGLPLGGRESVVAGFPQYSPGGEGEDGEAVPTPEDQGLPSLQAGELLHRPSKS